MLDTEEDNKIKVLIEKQNNDIRKVIKINSELAMSSGGNYMSIITRYKIQVLLKNYEVKENQLIVKSLPAGLKHRKFIDEFNFFKNEITVYKELLQNMKILMHEFKDKRETIWSDLIGYEPYKRLILEDLSVDGFCLMNRFENLDYDHTVFTIKSLARFHAMSAVLLERKIVNLNDFEPYQFAKKKICKYFFWCNLTIFEKAIRDNWGDGWKNLADKINNIKENVYENLQELLKIDNNRFNVINHGDSWTNNLLFKHTKGTNTPCGIKFLDYQISHYNSFVWDLNYFFYTSIIPELRRIKFDHLLSIYHQELSNNLIYFNYPKLGIPTLNHVIEEMKRIKYYGFILLATIYPWTTADNDNPYDVEYVLTNGNNPEFGVNMENFTSARYRQMVEADMLDFINEEDI